MGLRESRAKPLTRPPANSISERYAYRIYLNFGRVASSTLARLVNQLTRIKWFV